MTEHLSSPLGAEKCINLRMVESLSVQKSGTEKPLITATPFIPIDPRRIPTRQWLYGFHMIRGNASATIAPGGIGKSSLLIAEALAIATGRPLLGIQPDGRANVWIWNGEDPRDELERRVTGAMLHHSIDPREISGRLFLDSGREQELIIAETSRSGTQVIRPLEERMVQELISKQIGLFTVDPFVSSHRVTENDNNAIDIVVKTWARIAQRAKCAVELVHHVRKTNGTEVTVEDGRGASALLAAVRSARVLKQMTTEEAKEAGVENRKAFFKVEIGKANLSLPPDKAKWFMLSSVNLGNGPPDASQMLGDNVGVVGRWTWPSALDGLTVSDLLAVQRRIHEGQWREDIRSSA
ncbi:AAA family ATPase [Beijerinckia indica]|uniref:RecA-family ATPase-like protein n=1 Tax=Beijerinckia indica subsp. indica (strain ATCC 9039 / DSM 1715 / NCIMB 8712) TaxID=395963 RepID=B2IJC5_BEII9|nr:AAA family ATPase [Beijerinckia indica]ACB96243.1 conserved hypothetical protein [Beijerinckia indica subsp. indica ATCC 9039]